MKMKCLSSRPRTTRPAWERSELCITATTTVGHALALSRMREELMPNHPSETVLQGGMPMHRTPDGRHGSSEGHDVNLNDLLEHATTASMRSTMHALIAHARALLRLNAHLAESLADMPANSAAAKVLRARAAQIRATLTRIEEAVRTMEESGGSAEEGLRRISIWVSPN